MFSQMKRNCDCVVPDSVTYNTLINGLGFVKLRDWWKLGFCLR